jgi:hypothetical protein
MRLDPRKINSGPQSDYEMSIPQGMYVISPTDEMIRNVRAASASGNDHLLIQDNVSPAGNMLRNLKSYQQTPSAPSESMQFYCPADSNKSNSGPQEMMSSYNASAGRAYNSYSSVGVRHAISRENNSSACTTTNENMSIIDEE